MQTCILLHFYCTVLYFCTSKLKTLALYKVLDEGDGMDYIRHKLSFENLNLLIHFSLSFNIENGSINVKANFNVLNEGINFLLLKYFHRVELLTQQ